MIPNVSTADQITAAAYTESAVTATAPAGTTRLNVWTWKSGAAGSLFVDDVCLTVSGTGGDTQPPSVPTQLAASAVGTTSFTLGWAASSDNVGVTGYEVFRDGASIGTPGGTSFNVRSESLGRDWTVSEAVVKTDGTRAGIVRGTVVSQATSDGPQPVSEPAAAVRVDFAGSQWYVDGQPVLAAPGAANCAPLLVHG